MKYALMFLGLLAASIVLGMLTMPREGTIKNYLLFANVLVASVLLGLMVAHVISIR